ncbi:hypothetical protein ASPSYDRAFT_53623 [Aspergillus sydowii CBS 593.65]|uniref:Major facilitator superfamily (MFS) profile domain-containing protein n=1 Tax=Aspergillus sydowii CBS 593.65 TaxID=1036612 RepID=A0A1L9TX73_9EURO|nr:uncharacterized protein ASPSYDRAFT_53623 [Aspergillus sydowii CBS 593.65]OJJ64037.1 hypothetical protein ASPSYDRAFT_53623 [Aspergillus sydowii CBS 593.65]
MASYNAEVSHTITTDNIQVLGLRPDDAEFYMNYSPEARKRLLWKVDVRLVPMLAALYLSHLDRANIGNAKIEGLLTDLALDGVQWNVVLSIIFIPYILLEVPSNWLLKSLSQPSTYLGILITGWGIVMTLTGVVQNFAGLAVNRIFLGIFETGFFPGSIYLFTFWYMPKELFGRLALFHCASALAGAFSGLLAAGIARMDGVGRQEGWRWIFIIELLATVILGVSWLEPEEIRYLELQHFIKEGGHFKDKKKKIPWNYIKETMLNWRMYGFLMTVTPYIAGAISAVFFSILSDSFYWRMPFEHIGPAYFAVVLATVGFYPTYPSTASWMANNLAPSSWRAIGTVFNISIAIVGGIVGSFMYVERENPYYYTGFGLSESDIRGEYTDEKLLETGNKSPFFKYTI